MFNDICKKLESLQLEQPLVSATVTLAGTLIVQLFLYLLCKSSRKKEGKLIPLSEMSANILKLLTLPDATDQWFKTRTSLKTGAIELVLEGCGSFDVRVDDESVYYELSAEERKCIKEDARELWKKLIAKQVAEETAEKEAEKADRQRKVAQHLRLLTSKGQQLRGHGND